MVRSAAVESFNSCASRTDGCQCLIVHTSLDNVKNMPITLMTNVVCESNLRPVLGPVVASMTRKLSCNQSCSRVLWPWCPGIKCRDQIPALYSMGRHGKGLRNVLKHFCTALNTFMKNTKGLICQDGIGTTRFTCVMLTCIIFVLCVYCPAERHKIIANTFLTRTTVCLHDHSQLIHWH